VLWYWLLGIVGLVALLIAIAGIWGNQLPQNHTATRTIHLDQSPDTVFKTISDWQSFPSWRKDVKSVRARQGEGGRDSWIEVSRHGEIPFEVIESQPPRKLVSKIADPNLPFGGTWTWQVAPDSGAGGGCTVTVTEDGEIYNRIFRFIARYVFGYTATMDGYLKSLAEKFGEPATPATART
jgi:uncharacterized protein YndB with AHSA1/START domain